MAFLRFLQFLTSGVTMWRLWQISERYIPREVIQGLRSPTKDQKTMGKPSARILVRSLAIWHTFKNGGNDTKNQEKVKKQIKKTVLNK
jgi:hypothetical protein